MENYQIKLLKINLLHLAFFLSSVTLFSCREGSNLKQKMGAVLTSSPKTDKR